MKVEGIAGLVNWLLAKIDSTINAKGTKRRPPQLNSPERFPSRVALSQKKSDYQDFNFTDL